MIRKFTAALAIGALSLTGAAHAFQDEDSSRWRYLRATDGHVVIISDAVEGRTSVKRLSTYTAFPTTHSSGAEGYLTEYEVNCRTETIHDLGSKAMAGERELGALPSQTPDGPTVYQPHTLFGEIGVYACTRRIVSGDRRVITGRQGAVEYARTRAR